MLSNPLPKIAPKVVPKVAPTIPHRRPDDGMPVASLTLRAAFLAIQDEWNALDRGGDAAPCDHPGEGQHATVPAWKRGGHPMSATAVVPLAPPPRSSLVRAVDSAGFASLAEEWNALVEATTPEPFYRHESLCSVLDNFLPGRPHRTLLVRDTTHRLVAALPLVRQRRLLYGLPVRQLASPANLHSNRFDLVAEEAPVAAAALVSHLVERERWDVLTLTEVPDGGKAWYLYEAAREAGLLVGCWQSNRSPYLTLPGSYELLQRGLRTKFLANLRRRRRRLEEKGTVTIERVAGGALQPAHFEECLALEQGGWKGRGGTALSQRRDVHGFYVQRAAAPFFRDHLSLFLLRLDGRPIAFHYGLTYRGTYSLLMTAYDEAFAECSPGHLLVDELLRDCVARGLREFDFLGCDLPWKLEWTSTVRGHSWLYVFRDHALGRLLHRAKFGWAPAVRRAWGGWLGGRRRPAA